MADANGTGVELLTTEDDNVKALLVELGANSVEQGIAIVRNMKATATAEVSAVTVNDGGASTADPRKVLDKFRAFSAKIESLNGTVSSMETQLQSLYSDRERLEREIGASEVDDVIAAFEALKITIASMDKQLMTLYAGRELLDTEIGKSDPTELVEMFRTVSHMVRTAHRELDLSAVRQ